MSLRRSIWQAIRQTLRLPLFDSSARQLRCRRVPLTWQTPALVQPVESKILLSGVTALGPEHLVNTAVIGTQITQMETRSNVATDAQGNYVVTWSSSGQDGSGDGVSAQRYDVSGNKLGSEFRVNVHANADQHYSTVSMNAAGEFVITWSSFNQDFSGYGVYARRYDASGNPLTSEFRVNQATGGNQVWSTVSLNDSGEFVITWSSFGQDGSDFGVYARRYDASGIAVDNEFRVNQVTSGEQSHSTVSLNDAGQFVITWSSLLEDNNGYDVYARLYDASGNGGAEVQVNQTTSGDQIFSSVSMNDTGEFVITWSSFGQDLSSYGVYARQFAATGSALGNEFRVNTYTTGDQSASSVALNNTGQFVITWMSAVQDGSNFGVYAQAFGSLGLRIGGEFRVNTFTADAQLYSSVSLNDAGECVIAWSSLNQDSDNWGVFARRYRIQQPPVPVGTEQQANTHTLGSQRLIHEVRNGVAVDGKGNYVVTWASDGQDGDSSGVYAQRFDARGNKLGGEFRVNATTTGSQYAPAVSMNELGEFVIAWTSFGQDGSVAGVYAQRFDAQGDPLGVEFRVNTTTEGTQTIPTVSVNAAGEFVIAWYASQDGDGWGVYAQRFDAGGNKVGAEFRVNTTTADNQEAPAVSLNDAGEFVITWSGESQDGSDYNIYAQRFDAGGNKLGGEMLINQTTADTQRFASVSLNNRGEFVVTWESYNQDGNNYGIYARRYDHFGSPAGDEFLVKTTPTDGHFFTSVSLNEAGEFVIAWSSTGQDGSGYAILAQAYDADGYHLGGEFRVNTYATSNQWISSVSLNDAGQFVIVWNSAGQDGSGDGVFAQQFKLPRGQFALGTEHRVNTYTTDNQDNYTFSPRNVAMDAQGNYLVVWSSLGQDGSGSGVYAQRFDASGNAIGGEFRVNTTTTGHQFLGTVSMNAAGEFVISWTSGGGIYAQRFDASGNKLGDEFQVHTTVPNSQGYSSVSLNDAGQFVITWDSAAQDGSGFGVYAQRFDKNGSLVGSEFRVNTTTAGDQQTSSVSLSGSGEFVITWTSVGQDGSGAGVYAQRFDANGNALGSEFRINATTASHQQFSSVSLNEAGEFVITWSSNLQDGSSYGVYAQRFDENGSPVGSEFRVNTTTANDQVFSTVSLNDAGEFVITWTSVVQDGGGSGVYAQRFDANGNALGGEFRVNSTTANDQYYSSVLLNEAGQFVIAWTSLGQDGSGTGVYARSGWLGSLTNQPPVATAQTATGEEDKDLLITLAGTDGDNQTLTAKISTLPTNGQLFQTSDGVTRGALITAPDTAVTDSQRRVIFVPVGNAFGSPYTTFGFKVNDGVADSAEATVTVNITAVNDAPTVTGPVTSTKTEDDATFTVNLLTNASDADSDTLQILDLTLTGGDDSGITINGDNSLSVDPSAYNHLAVNEQEVITYSYNMIDSKGGSVSQTATITITGVNDQPTVTGAVTSTKTEDEAAYSLDLLSGASDPDTADTLNVSNLTLTGGDDSGITINGDNSLSIDPSAYNDLAANEQEVITYTYNVVDGKGGSVSQTATITITGVNDNPTVAADNAKVTVNEGQTLTNTGTFGDADLSDEVTISASIGSISQGHGTWSWSLATTDDLPLTTVTITADDGNGGVVTTTFDVQANNVAPTLTLSGDTTVSEGSTYTLNLASSDPGADTITQWVINWGDGSTPETVTGTPSSATHTYADDGTYTISATATDEDGTFAAGNTVSVTTENEKPVVTNFDNVTFGDPLNAPATGGVPGQALKFSGTFSDVGLPDTHTATVNWGDGSATEDLTLEQLSGGGNISGGHTYLTTGTFSITVAVTDDDGGVTEQTFQVVISTTALVPDTCNRGKLALIVGGTDENDTIVINKVGKRGDVRVIVNGTTIGTFRPTGRIIVYGLDGNDTIRVRNTITNSAWLYGGDGDDRLYGGRGHDVLLGGDGNDLLQGHLGRDVMIGGHGSDALMGFSKRTKQEDVAIGGWLVLEDQESGLCELMHTWTSNQSLAARQAEVKGLLIPGLTVFTNAADRDRFTDVLVVTPMET